MKALLTLLFIQFCALSFTANITTIRGDVYLNGSQIKTVSTVSEGDTIWAKGKKSFFVVKYENGSKYMVRNGKIKVEKLEKKKSALSLLFGDIFSSVKEKQGQEFEIRTKTAALGVRGTEFFVSEAPGDTYLCVCKGSVSAKNKTGEILVSKKQDVHVKENNQLSTTTANEQMWSMATDGFKELNSY